MKRHQQILAAVLVLQIILSIVTFWPRTASGEGGKPAIPDLQVKDIAALTITNDQHTTISLRKVEDEWGLTDADQYPAKSAEIEALLEQLTQLDTGNLVASTDTSHRQLQVAGDSYLRRVDLELTDGTKYTIYFGSAPRYTATHFRVAGQVETYLTTVVSTWELNPTPSSWVNTTYTELDQTTLTEVTLANANGTFTFVKEGEDWTLVGLAEGETLAAGKISDIVSKSSRVTMLRPLGKTEKPEYGMNAPLATVTLKSADAVYTVQVGAKNTTDNTYTVKSSESEYYVAVAEYSVKSLVENTREDFLQAPEETPTSTP